MRFLIADDSPEFRAAARELLELRGHVVVAEVASSEAALAAAKEARPEAAVIDVRLGSGSGLVLSRALVAAQPQLAVVLVSVSDEVPPDVVRACGARAFVEKGRLGEVDLSALLEPGQGGPGSTCP